MSRCASCTSVVIWEFTSRAGSGYISEQMLCRVSFFFFSVSIVDLVKDPWVFNFLSMLSLAFVSDMWYRHKLTFSKQNYGPSHDLAVCTLLRCSSSGRRLNSACNVVRTAASFALLNCLACHSDSRNSLVYIAMLELVQHGSSLRSLWGDLPLSRICVFWCLPSAVCQRHVSICIEPSATLVVWHHLQFSPSEYKNNLSWLACRHPCLISR